MVGVRTRRVTRRVSVDDCEHEERVTRRDVSGRVAFRVAACVALAAALPLALALLLIEPTERLAAAAARARASVDAID